jgi:hypothetical protein
MISSEGYIKPDVNRNTIIGINVTIDTKSVGNFIVAENAIVTNSHNNILNAKNVQIENASGCRADGADHTIKFGANYSSVDGDANWVEGYSSHTTGFGNVNCGEYGSIDGNNNRIGIKGQSNKFTGSSIKGSNCQIDGSNSHAIGSFIRIIGNNITVIGNPKTSDPFTVPGVYIIN